MTTMNLDIVIIGLSITSSWGNGHATTYRGLVRELVKRGHRVLFLERDVPWYAPHRDLPDPFYGQIELYDSVDELRQKYAQEISDADLVIVGSYVPDGVEVGQWVQKTARRIVAFYDIDTPVTLAKLKRQDHEYLSPEMIPEYDLFLSFTGGPTLETLEQVYGAPVARPLYCSLDQTHYYPEETDIQYDLGYLGTYSDDRQPTVEKLLMEPARQWEDGRFAVAGPQYPEDIEWPENVERTDHLPPSEHRAFYNSQRFTLNVTRADMIRAGYCPSIRLFEAAGCATPIISDSWAGLDTLFEIGTEILTVPDSEKALDILKNMPDDQRREIGRRARQRVLECHTAAHRAQELEEYCLELLNLKSGLKAVLSP